MLGFDLAVLRRPRGLELRRSRRVGRGPAWLAAGLLAAVTLAIGLAAQTLLDYSQAAASSLRRR
jgi:hypothetical protein